MIVVGTVIKLKGKTVTVKTERPASCEHCSAASVCNKKETVINVLNTVDAKTGDKVKVYVENDKSAMAVLAYMFLIPVIILIAGYVLYKACSHYVIIPILLSLLPYFFGLKYFNKKFSTKAYTQEILDEDYINDTCTEI